MRGWSAVAQVTQGLEGHEGESTRAQRRDELTQRFDGGRAVPAPVMHQDDASRLHLTQDHVDNPRRRNAPGVIPRVDIPGDDSLAVALGVLGDAGVQLAAWWPEEPRAFQEQGLEQGIGAVNFQGGHRRGHGPHDVIPGVIADFEAARLQFLDESGGANRFPADDEERRGHLGGLEERQDLWGELWTGTVIEGQGHQRQVGIYMSEIRGDPGTRRPA